MTVDAKNCIVHVPDNKLVLLQGLDEFIVVDTKDVLLICKKEKEQEIKDYVAEVKRNMGEKYLWYLKEIPESSSPGLSGVFYF